MLDHVQLAEPLEVVQIPTRQGFVPLVIVTQKLGDGSTSEELSDVKPQGAHRPKKPTIWHKSSQDERQAPSTRQASSAPKRFARQAYKQTSPPSPSKKRRLQSAWQEEVVQKQP
ncbi:hypothetical protein ABBQ38_013649 [Trebouxia sp. C0009 RCD-2024]